MRTNPILQRLGFQEGDRVLILHADDLGMCQGTLLAFAELVEFGLLCSGSVMVPCAGFQRVADYCHEHPFVDMGVHLTLTSEHNSYRWGPVSVPDPASGLLDDEGYFPHCSEELGECVDRAAIETELKCQIRRAREAGIDVSHLDLHMGCLIKPNLLPLYLRLASEARLPALVWRPKNWPIWGFNTAAAAVASSRIDAYQHRGGLVFDHVAELPLDNSADRLAQVQRICDTLAPGLNLLYTHPAVDTPELRTITPDWPSRVADYQVFRSRATRAYLRTAEIHLLSYRQLREGWLDLASDRKLEKPQDHWQRQRHTEQPHESLEDD